MSRRFLIINSIFLGIATFVQWGLSGFLGVIGEAIDLIMCAGVATFLILLIRWSARDFRRVYIRSFFFLSGFLGICSTILLIFIIIQNTFPGAVGKIILTNSEKTIVFYQMSHIATPEFYTDVQHDLQVLTDSGYTIYAEGVRPGTRENMERFDRLLGVKFTDTLYTKIASTIGLVAQDASLYSGIASGSVRNVDISIDDIMARIGTGKILPPPIDLEKELDRGDLQETGFLFSPLMRAVFNFFLKHENGLDRMELALDPGLFSGILHDRNIHIVDTLQRETDKNIVLVYGALHFQGVYDLLRAHDPRWKITRVDPLYPYSY